MLEFILVWILFSPAVCLLVGKMIATGNKNKTFISKLHYINKNLFFFSSRFSI